MTAPPPAPRPGLDPFVHWGDEAARPTSLHGNGAASFERVTLDPAEVTCGLCLHLLDKDGPAPRPCDLSSGKGEGSDDSLERVVTPDSTDGREGEAWVPKKMVRASEADTLRAAAQHIADDRDACTQAMWEALGILGFDLDGDETPRAQLTRGVRPFIDSFLAHMREMRADYDAACEEVCDDQRAHEPAPRSDAPEPSTVDAGRLSEDLTAELTAWGLQQGGGGIHSWRCDHPDRYGECTDLAELVADLARIVADREERARAEAWDEACHALAWCLENGPMERALPYVAEHNPYRRASSAPTEGEQR